MDAWNAQVRTALGSVGQWRTQLFPALTQTSLFRHYIPLSGAVSQTLYSMHVFSPSVVTGLFPVCDLAVSNTILFNSHLGVALYVFFRPHMHRLNLWDRVQFSVFSSGMFNFGSLALAVLVKAFVPKRLPTLPKSILAAGLSVFLMTSGANYLRYIDSATLSPNGPRMSSIQTVPVEILLDIFQATDPAGTEALQLTCRRFRNTIRQNMGTLPTRLACELTYESNQVHLYRASASNDVNRGWSTDRERIASTSRVSQKIREMYKMFGCKTAIRKVQVCAGAVGVDGLLTRLIENFPPVKGAAILDACTRDAGLPTDAMLNHFTRLETIKMRTRVGDNDSSFWSDLFATKAFRRVRKFCMANTVGQYPAVHDRKLLDFITCVSHMPAYKPRVVYIAGLGRRSVDAVERRFNEHLRCSIDGQVCAVIKGPGDHDYRYLSNMAVGSKNKFLAEQLLRDA
ncbi:Protein C09G9.1 b [Aphelenchoides avenae]|nr:Protein C09G9.1 b [Aphelenchus avenae]